MNADRTPVRPFAILVIAAVAACAASCSAPPAAAEATGASRSAIIGGAMEPGHLAVAGILAFDLQTYCSGTLIAPRTVLTAGHCANAATSFSTYSAVFGANDSGTSIAIVRQVTHPNYTASGKPFDFALFELKSAPPGVVPFPFARRALPGLHAGTALTHVGFGATADGQLLGDGKKRVVTTPITRIDTNFVYSGTAVANTCNGDSGGPGTIVGTDGSEILVSVISDGPSCTVEGWDGRVEEVADWIRTTALRWETQFPDETNPQAADAGASPDAAAAPSSPSAGSSTSGSPEAMTQPAVSPPASDAGPPAASGCSASAAHGDAGWPWPWLGLGLLGAMAARTRASTKRRSRLTP